MPFATTDLCSSLADIAAQARPHATEGEVARHVPGMAPLGSERFAMAVHGIDGASESIGDTDETFPIQSVSKVLSLVLALQKVGEDELWERVGREPSGDPFNSLVQLEHEQGIPRNPMINAGALVVDDVLLEACGDATSELHELVEELVGAPLELDDEIVDGQSDSGFRNRAMASLMRAFGNLHHPVDDVIGVYVRHCAIRMTTPQLAAAFRFLANDGVEPRTGRRILSEQLARRVNAVMLTTGTYDAAGEFAYQVGFPCKSGVSGAIVGVVPDHLAVAVWSPPLDDSGNSLAGREALHLVAERHGLSIF
ncbi:glutaminase [Nitriliruptoraceae bacterium ZYF776]|nr:glutaminase [Profundirhabdus halotolerans]